MADCFFVHHYHHHFSHYKLQSTCSIRTSFLQDISPSGHPQIRNCIRLRGIPLEQASKQRTVTLKSKSYLVQIVEQWHFSILGKSIKIREQVERLTRFLLWSDTIVKSVLSTQPCAALGWTGISLILPVSETESTDIFNSADIYSCFKVASDSDESMLK